MARDTNVFTNIVPEVKNNFLWNILEEYCRDELTKDFETIYVMSGTLFLPEDDEDGQTESRTKEEASATADVVSASRSFNWPSKFINNEDRQTVIKVIYKKDFLLQCNNYVYRMP